MSVSHDDLVPLARRLLRRHLGDLLLRMPSPGDRGEWVDAEADSLAQALAETAEQRVDELRVDLAADIEVVEVPR